LFGALALSPPGVGERLGQALGELAYRLGWRTRVVEEQIGRAYPDRDEEWVQQTAKACYRHLGREWLTVPYFTRRGLEEVRRRLVEFEGREVLAAAYEEGRGVVIVTGHLGNWELAGSALAAFGYPVDAVMQGMMNPYIGGFIRDVRQRNGMGLIDRALAWDRLRESLAAKRLLAFVADQDAREKGVFVPFFGRPASTNRAPALLALRAGAPFLVGGAQRVGPREYHGWMVRIDPPDGVEVGEQVYDMTKRWVEELERRVRLYPEQYFWHHKRWKSIPPGTEPVGVGTRDRDWNE
jgi:KDO2-lipid IV(A) lauroyltransferase